MWLQRAQAWPSNIFFVSGYRKVFVFIPFLMREGSTLFGDHRGSVLLD